MASSLRITNIPAYITESEFKRIWNQPGLECQSCTFTKSAKGEIIGFAYFANPQAAGRARAMYQGWQGYGNPEGLRIEMGAEDRPAGLKREREDVGGEELAYKQGRLLGAGTVAYAGGATMSNYPNSNVPIRAADNAAYTPAPNQPVGAGSMPMGQPPAAQASSMNFQGSQAARPGGYMGQMQQGMPSQGLPPQVPPQAVSGPPGMQSYNQASMGFNASSQGFNLNPAQRPGASQQLYGGQDAGPSSQSGQYSRPQPVLQQPQPQGQQQVNPIPQNAQYNAPNGSAYQPGPSGQMYVADPQVAAQVYDPQNPQLGGTQQPPQQQAQPVPQQMASLANVLGPLLQQQQQSGLNLSNMNLGNLLSQGGMANLLPQQNTPQVQQQQQQQQQQQPMHAQMQGAPQMQLQGQQMMGGLPQAQPQPQQQMLATGRAEGMPGTEPLPAEAAETLYVDNMPMDVNRREMSHVFRPFEGFKDMRIVEKKDKHGSPLVIGFAEFENAHQANAALKTLQGYPLDMNKPTEAQLRISFAKPLKASDPRSRGQAVNRPYNSQPATAGNRMNDRARNDRGGGGGSGTPNSAGVRNDRDRRDRDRGGGARGTGSDRAELRKSQWDGDRRPGLENRRRY